MLAAIVIHYRTLDESLACARSLYAATPPPDRVILVDNGSGDGSAVALRAAFPMLTLVDAGWNRGFPAGCNLGVARALRDGADRIAIVNSDVVVPPRALADLDAALARRPDAGIAGPALVTRDARVESLGISFSPWTGRMVNRGAGARSDGRARADRDVDGVTGALMLLTRAVVERIGSFCEDFFYGFEDLDYCLRARAAGFAVISVGSVEVVHGGARTIGARSSRRDYFAARNHLLLARRAAPLPAPLAALRAGSITALNLAHALFRSPTPAAAATAAVARGVWHHLRGRYGDGP
jgi:GT2 family glycosyltransferase